MLSEPTMLTVASKAGRATETRTSACAARWNTSSGRRRAMSSTTAGALMSRWWMVRARPALARASARFEREPVEKSSTTSTSWPSTRRRSTRFEPMNPAPPVTSVRIPAPLSRDPLAVDQCARGDHGVSAQHRDRPHITALSDDGPRAHDGAGNLGVGGDVAALHEHRISDDGAGRDYRTRSDDAVFHPCPG